MQSGRRIIKKGEFQHTWFDARIGKWRPRHSRNEYEDGINRNETRRMDATSNGYSASSFEAGEGSLNGYTANLTQRVAAPSPPQSSAHIDDPFTSTSAGLKKFFEMPRFETTQLITRLEEETPASSSSGGNNVNDPILDELLERANASGPSAGVDVEALKRFVPDPSASFFRADLDQNGLIENDIEKDILKEILKQSITDANDMHDAIYEMCYYYRFKELPKRSNTFANMCKREIFKKHLCSYISRAIEDPRSNFAGIQRNQAEIPLSHFKPKLYVGTNPALNSEPSRILATPMARRGHAVECLEIFDMFMYNLGTMYEETENSRGQKVDKISIPGREVGRAETPFYIVPESSTIRTLVRAPQTYYSGPLHSVLRANVTPPDLLEKFVKQAHYNWFGDKIEEKTKYPLVHRHGGAFFTKLYKMKDFMRRLFPRQNTLKYY